MSIDIIERKQLNFPPSEGLPSTAAFVHRGGNFLYHVKQGKGDCLSVLTEGTAIREVSGKQRKFEAGSVFISLEGELVVHQSCDRRPHKVILFYYQQENARKLLREAWGPERVLSNAFPMVRTIMKGMYDELLTPMPFQASLLSAYHQSLMIMIARQAGKEPKNRNPASNLYNLAMHLINCFPEEIPTLYELSGKLGVTREHIIRTFKLKNTESPYQLLVKSRMERARDWLENTNWDIAKIAKRLGYNNSSSFIRTFKKVAGMTPRQSRMSSDFSKS